MECKSRCYLFIKKPVNGSKNCAQCNDEVGNGELVYSKRGTRYYCSACAFRLGFIGAKR